MIILNIKTIFIIAFILIIIIILVIKSFLVIITIIHIDKIKSSIKYQKVILK